jgi:NADH:ubiquinone oxidoreductase subunit
MVSDWISAGTSAITVPMSFGTWIYTMLNGQLVGQDEFGNRYYKGRGRKLNNRERRWVVYNGMAEASKVPPEWHAWIHHTTDEPLTERAARPRPWQKPHLPNLTGTTHAYRPQGHVLSGGRRAPATGDYEAWRPE